MIPNNHSLIAVALEMKMQGVRKNIKQKTVRREKRYFVSEKKSGEQRMIIKGPEQ